MEITCRKGVKRKREEEDNDVAYNTFYVWQRDLVFEQSKEKIRELTNPVGRIIKEPCLRRRCLIMQTLRSIETEIAQEGRSVTPHQSSEAAMNQLSEMSMAQLTLDPLPDMSSFMFPMPPSPMPMTVEALHGENDHGDYVSLANSLADSLVESGVGDLLPCQPVPASQEQQLPSGQSLSVSSSSPSPLYCNLQPPATASPACSAVFPETSSYLYSCPAALDSRDVPSLPASAYDGIVMDITPTLPPFSSWAASLVQELPKVCEDGDSNNNNNTATQGPYNNSVCSNAFGEEISESELIEFLHTLQDAAASSAADITATASPPPSSSPTSSSPSVLNGQCSTFCRSDSAVDELDSIMQVIPTN